MYKVVILVAGYCPPTKVDENAARSNVIRIFDEIAALHPGATFEVVSGLTKVGIMVHAYEEAKKRGWRTVGYACGLAADFEKFPVDEEHIIGNQWGAESVSFVDHATHSGNMFYMVNIAGGNQAARETEAVRFAGGTIYRVELTRE